MSTSKTVEDIIFAFAKQWNVPASEVEQLIRQTTTGGETPSHTIDAWEDETVFAEEVSDTPKTRKAVSTHSRYSIEPTDEVPMLGRYQDLGLLGVGSMGEVRLVRDLDLRRTLAIKILHQRLIGKPRIVSRFIEEAQVEAQLQHRNIVPVHELGCLPDGRHYFTMKQIRGTEFSKKIQSVHRHSSPEHWRQASDGTSFRDLVRIFQQVCETVAFAHSQGVIHRDLKPENVMVGDFGEVLVVDWGLAKVMGRDEPEFHDDDQVETDRSTSQMHQTRMGSIAGTPCYMAPEQAFGRTDEVGTATDVYTLGAILYEILSGSPPFQGMTVEAVLEQVKHHPPPVLRSLLDGDIESNFDAVTEEQPAETQRDYLNRIPDRLAEICENAMCRDIGDRTDSAGLMAAEIKGWLEGAEKRDKGLEEVSLAEKMAEDARMTDQEASLAWEEANRRLENEGVSSEAGWMAWEHYREAQARGRMLRRRYVRGLQGALVHAPGLEEAHQALAECRMEELVLSAALGDRLEQEALEQQLSHHLRFLPSGVQETFRSRLKVRLADKIYNQRLQRGSLVGRRVQRESVVSHVSSGTQLVTLLGTAGVGKTRLALELADELRPGFNRTVFCSLTEATDAMEVLLNVSRALDVRLRDSDPAAHLVEVLAAEPTLLVLDNLEQLTSVIGPLAEEWIQHVENLQILTTSRSPLGVPLETVVPIQPMSLLESVDLFIRRGQAVDRCFEWNETNRDLLCELVDQLDRLPLAIELAAARLYLFSLDELAQRLGERFSLLRSRGRDAQALDGALDWSWGLLQPWAKSALSQASLFRGGFTLAAAEGIIRVAEDKKVPAMFDILGELIDNSLLRKDRAESGIVRYSLLESIRVYAHDKLVDGEEIGDTLRQSQERHADYFSQMGTATALKALDGFDSAEGWMSLFSDLDNLVVGVEYGTTETAPLCCLAALKVFNMKGPMSLGVDLATKVLERSGLSKRIQVLIEIERSRGLRIGGRLAEAREVITSGTALLPGDPSGDETLNGVIPSTEVRLVEAERLLELGRIEWEQSSYDDALNCYQRALEIFQLQGHRRGEGLALLNLGLVHKTLGRHKQALSSLHEALHTFREIGNKRAEGECLGHLGAVHQLHGNQGRAQDHYIQALNITQAIGDRREEGRHLSNIGATHKVLGQYQEAIDHYTQALDIAQEIGDKRFEAVNFGNLGGVYGDGGQHAQSVEYYTQALSIFRSMGDKRSECVNLGNLGTVYQAMAQHKQAIEHTTQAIELARAIKLERYEGIFLGNLGVSLVSVERFDEAILAFQKAIAICEESVPGAAGAFSGSLAVLLAQQGHSEQAHALILAGVSKVEAVPVEHAKFLCRKGWVCHISGDEQGARTALKQAQQIAAELKVSSDSELGTSITELSLFVETDSGEDRGHAPTEDAQRQDVDSADYRSTSIRGLNHASYESIDVFELESETLQELSERAFDQAYGDWASGLNLSHQSDVGQSIASLHDVVTNSSMVDDDLDRAFVEAEHLQERGQIAYEQGQGDEAIRCFEGAYDLHRKAGNRAGESRSLQHLGNVYSRIGDSDQAIALYEQALGISREVGNAVDEGGILSSLATVRLNLDQYEEAQALYEQALQHHQDTGNRRAEGTAQGNLANLYIIKGDYSRAVDLLKVTVDIRREVGDLHGEGIDYGNLGDALFMLDQLDEAESAFRRAISICDEAVPPAAGVFRGSLGLLLGRRGLFDEAMDAFGAGEAQVEPIADEQIKFLCKKGQVQSQAGDRLGAQESLDRARLRGNNLKLTVGGDLETLLSALEHTLAEAEGSDLGATLSESGEPVVDASEMLRELGELALGSVNAKEAVSSCLYEAAVTEE